MSNELVKNLGELNGSVKNYVEARIDLVKLSLLEKTARLITYLVNYLVVLLFFILVTGFGVAAFAIWYGQTYNDNYVSGMLISGGILIGICLIFVLLRKKIITTSVIRNFSEILFVDEEK